ncbi:MAG: selenoneine biosynthesis selenosugar synthase SenB [Xanthomonadales bacterium]|nr:selenoneine biosynthesis selenosugar synthase SenB [Xanthomonadales bacterium]
MKIGLITPAARPSRSGNRATAERWQRLLRELGHDVSVAIDYRGEDVDLLLAVHAWRSCPSIRRFAEVHPDRPLVVLLAGTDIYRFQHEAPGPTFESMRAAHALIGLHENAAADIPAEFHDKLGVVLQSAEPLERRAPLKTKFEVCVIGHLRDEKDSLRTAYAVRDIPEDSRIAVTQLGRAHNDDWAERARAEAESNPRYRWWGERARSTVRRIMARSRVMVMSSRMEGGANAVAEACAAGLPVIASRIPGNIGLLGEDYPGYFPVEDTEALRQMLLRAESDPGWLEELRRHCKQRARLFTPEREREALAAIIDRAVSRARTG